MAVEMTALGVVLQPVLGEQTLRGHQISVHGAEIELSIAGKYVMKTKTLLKSVAILGIVWIIAYWFAGPAMANAFTVLLLIFGTVGILIT